MTQDNTNIKDKYEIIFDDTDATKWCVRLLEPAGLLHGVVYSYGEFTIKPGTDADPEPKFSFATEIISVPDRLKDATLPDEEESKMQTLLALILIDIVEGNMSKTRAENGKLFLELVKDDK